MDMKFAAMAVAGICILVLLIGILKQKSEFILNFLVRMSVGLICVYFVNTFLATRGIGVAVGVNLLSALTLGSLGFMAFFSLIYCESAQPTVSV